MSNFMKVLARALKLLIIMIGITGIIYPLTVTAIGQVFFENKANGSIIEDNGKQVGSELIGQNFSDPKYFGGRPSSTVDYPYNALGSAGSNKSPVSDDLDNAIKERVATLKKFDNSGKQIPVDLVTASASGLDPHISIESAKYQVSRVAKLRNISEETLSTLIDNIAEKPVLDMFGTPKINVLKLNLELDKIS